MSVAKNGPDPAVQAQENRAFLQTVRASARMVGLIVRDLRDRSILEKVADGYRAADPLLQELPKLYR